MEGWKAPTVGVMKRGSVGSVRIHLVELAEIGMSNAHTIHSVLYIHTVQDSHVEVSTLCKTGSVRQGSRFLLKWLFGFW